MTNDLFPELLPVRRYLAGTSHDTATTETWLALAVQWRRDSPRAAAAWPTQSVEHARAFHEWHAAWMGELASLDQSLRALRLTQPAFWWGASACAP